MYTCVLQPGKYNKTKSIEDLTYFILLIWIIIFSKIAYVVFECEDSLPFYINEYQGSNSLLSFWSDRNKIAKGTVITYLF